MSKHFAALFIVFITITCGIAQPASRSAVDLYMDGKYAEAAVILEQQINIAPESSFTLLLKCYKELKRYDDAEKLIKKQLRKRETPLLWVDKGYFQHLQKKQEDAQESYNKALEFVANNAGLAFSVSERFSEYGLFKQALYTFEVAEASNPNMVFHYQKGLIYAELGDVNNMYAEYLAMVEQNPSYLMSVKQRIARNINENPNNEANVILKKQLIKKIQQTQNPIFTELLIWLYVEETDYDKAFRQLKALDKRDANRDREIYSLGERAMTTQQYPVARECFNYVAEKGELSAYSREAVFNELEAQRLQMETSPLTKKNEYKTLLQKYISAEVKLTGSDKLVAAKRNEAHLLFFNLNEKDSAISVLNNTITRYDNRYKFASAECKMLLGDILLAENEPVEAIFQYMKVERTFSGSPQGDQAKFMKAMVAYYTTDFPWALNQFEVLKSSTTKLISNDALEMALLITDNSKEDTLYQGLTYYAKADLFAFRNLPDSALATLDLLLAVFPNHELKAEATLLQANLFVKKDRIPEAISALENLISSKSGDIWTDDALMLLGQIYAENIGDKEKAMQAYEQILFDHSGSTFVPEARRRYRNLRGDKLTN